MLTAMSAASVLAQTSGDAGPRTAGAEADAGVVSVAPRQFGTATATPAAPSADAAAGAGSSTPALVTTMGVPTFKPRAPPLPPPTPQQSSAYEAMRQEAETYERGARDYKDTLTTIITLHYEEKKKSILGGLDREIGIEKDQLKAARETAIKRLEDFVAKYSGPNAQEEATPDAMYRLAALYEERARSDDDPNADLASTLRPAIALYKRVIREFPEI